jgi:hypothetical protein
VPGQPFSKCLPPATAIVAAVTSTADGASRPLTCRRAKRGATEASTGSAARITRTSKIGIVTVVATVARPATAVVLAAPVHCQAMVSCDHIAAPKQRKTARQPPSETRLAVTWRSAASDSGLAAPDRSGKPHRPADAKRASIPPRMMSRVRATERGRSVRSQRRSSANSSP